MNVAFKYEIGQLVYYNNHLYRVLSRAYFETKDVSVNKYNLRSVDDHSINGYEPNVWEDDIKNFMEGKIMGEYKNNVYFKLMKVQSKLKCEKSQYNKFGGYAYRSTSDILEAVKPLLSEVEAVIIVNDELKLIGDRYYVEATAMFLDCETGDSIVSRAIAREAEGQKGMSEAQVTGSSSSYARKYALNALLLIDDTKDDDFTNTCGKDIKPNMTPVSGLSEAQIKRLLAIGNKSGFNKDTIVKTVKKLYGCELKDMTREQYNTVCERLEKKVK